jgi:hypothetical protein
MLRLLIESSKEFAILHSLNFTRVAIAEQPLIKTQWHLGRISETEASRPEGRNGTQE